MAYKQDNFEEKDFLGGNEKIFEFFFRKNYRLLVSFSNSLVNDRALAEDLVQELFVELWDKRRTIVIHSSLQSYLLTSVRNKSLDKLRKLRINRETETLDELNEPVLPFNDRLEIKETGRSLVEAISKLSPQCKMVFVLCRFEKYTYAQVAELMNISVKTVENHMGRALKTLREHMEKINENPGFSMILFLISENYSSDVQHCNNFLTNHLGGKI